VWCVWLQIHLAPLGLSCKGCNLVAGSKHVRPSNVCICWSSASLCTHVQKITEPDGQPAGCWQVLLGKHGRPAGAVLSASPCSVNQKGHETVTQTVRNIMSSQRHKRYKMNDLKTGKDALMLQYAAHCATGMPAGSSKGQSQSVAVSRASLLRKMLALSEKVTAFCSIVQPEHNEGPPKCATPGDAAQGEFKGVGFEEEYARLKAESCKSYSGAWEALLSTNLFALWLRKRRKGLESSALPQPAA
jgi:hypothetical protein